MKSIDRSALISWADYCKDIKDSTPVDTNMSMAEREKHKLYLEAHPIEWIKFFFPKYAKYEFAPFQIKAINRVLAHDEWYEVLSWSRELAKSTIWMFIVMYLALTGKKRNVMLAAATLDAAKRLLAPYRANFENNGRIKRTVGKAFVSDSTNSKLRVQFFWPFRGDYWIIDLAPDYSWAVVSDRSRSSLWILSRTPKLDDKTLHHLLDKLVELGYDKSRIHFTQQN